MAFQSQCEDLLKQQQKIEGLADDLDHNLKYYNYLEPATRRLNAPGAGSFVRSKEFSEMLSRIDECLDYFSAHVSLPVSQREPYNDIYSPINEKPRHICPVFVSC